MILVIGGCAQGKRAYALRTFFAGRPVQEWRDGVAIHRAPSSAAQDEDLLSSMTENDSHTPRKYGESTASTPVRMADGQHCTVNDLARADFIVNLHEFIRRHRQGDACPLPSLRADAVVVCDEVGSGIVPVDPDERQYREAVGRAGCRLAEEADQVILLRFGIPQRIK